MPSIRRADTIQRRIQRRLQRKRIRSRFIAFRVDWRLYESLRGLYNIEYGGQAELLGMSFSGWLRELLLIGMRGKMAQLKEVGLLGKRRKAREDEG